MGPYDSLWLPLGPYGYLWFFYVSLWFLMVPFVTSGSLWLLLVSFGSLGLLRFLRIQYGYNFFCFLGIL